MDQQVLKIAALLVGNAAGEWLHVRKRATTAFMMPGGKLEPGETGRECVVREIQEELGLSFQPESLQLVGVFQAAAANEAGWLVECEVFYTPELLEELPQVRAEIVEARWFARTATDECLAPLSRDVVFPQVVEL